MNDGPVTESKKELMFDFYTTCYWAINQLASENVRKTKDMDRVLTNLNGKRLSSNRRKSIMAAESIKAIICRITSEEYALNVNHVLSIERIQEIRQIPHTEAYMAGIIQLRGSIVPVMDLKIWLGWAKAGNDQEVQTEKRIVVTEYNEKRLGLIVDAATDVMDIAASSIQSVEIHEGSKEVNQVANLESRLILILDVPKLIEQLNFVFDQVETA